MTRSGSWSPTCTELNSRSAIRKALSALIRSTRQGRVRLLDRLAGLVGDDVLGHDDVGAVRLANRVHGDVAVQPVARVDRTHELELLVDLHDLRVLEGDVGVGEERRLRLVAEDR